MLFEIALAPHKRSQNSEQTNFDLSKERVIQGARWSPLTTFALPGSVKYEIERRL